MCWCQVLIASLILFNYMVSAGKNDIIVNVSKDSWIAKENFATMIKLSFDASNCCNIIIGDESRETKKLFNEFIKIYPYEYVIRQRTYYCRGYFMLSRSAATLVKEMEKVPTAISTTELLIIIDDNVHDTIALLNVSMYQNANVNIVAHNGIWKLSEKCVEPRVFESVISHHEMAHNRGIVDFRGRELQAAAFFKPPFCYLSTTVNRTINGIRGQFFLAKNESELDGVETKLFLLIASNLNFTWKIRKPKNNDHYGRTNDTHWIGGMIGLLTQKEVDIAFTSAWVALDNLRFTNITVPWTMSSLNFLVPRPKPYTSFWALTRTLSPEVWSAVVAMLIFQSIYVYTRAWVNPRIPRRFRSFTITWTEMMGRLIGIVAPTFINGLEMQFQLWNAISILIVTAYSSSLAANLASSSYEKRIDTLQDFIAANLTWGVEGQVPNFTNLFIDLNDPYGGQLPLRFQHEDNEAERHEKILNGNYAVFGRMLGVNFFPEYHIRNEDLEDYRLMKQSLGTYYLAFLVQPCLLESVDKVMLWIVESGFAAYHLRDVLRRRTESMLREVLIEFDGKTNSATVLQLTPLGAGFFTLIVGLSFSSIVFYLELKSSSGILGAALQRSITPGARSVHGKAY